MDRNREARRASIVSSNGFNRRRFRTNSLRDSPDEDMGLELQESVRLRERVKKDRDREREFRDRDLRERPNRVMNSSIKRRRNERLMNHNRGGVETGNDETSEEESVNDEEDDVEDEDNNTTNHHHHHNNSSFSQTHHSNNTNNSNNNHSSSNNITNSSNNHPVTSSSNSTNTSKAFRAPPVWRSSDEVINVSVPRKARSSSAKRSHDWISSISNNNSGGDGGGEQIIRQASDSPARQGGGGTTSSQAPTPPSSSNASIRKKLKPSVHNNNGLTPKPPKAASKSSSNPEELEIEIAEVLYGLMTQSHQGPSSSCKKEEVNRSNSDAKSRNSSPVSNSTSNNNLVSGPNCNSSPLTAVAPKRKKPRQVPESMKYSVRSSPVTAREADQKPKSEISPEKVSPSSGENGSEIGGNSVISQAHEAQPPPESKDLTSEVRDNINLGFAKEEIISPKEKECSVVRTEGINSEVSTSVQTSNLKVYQVENHKEEKFEIDLMAPPPQVRSSSPERETGLDLNYATDRKTVHSVANVDLKPVMSRDNEDGKEKIQEKKRKGTREEESELPLKTSEKNNGMKINLQLDLEKKPESDCSEINVVGNKLQKMPARANKEHSVTEKHSQSTSSMPLPLSLASWPPMGYMAPLQGVVSMDGTSVASAPIQPMLTQPRPKRCATHCHIARNIYYQQQFMKMTPYQPMFSPLFGSKPCNVSVMPGLDHHGNLGNTNINAQGKAHNSDNNTLNNSNDGKGSTQHGSNMSDSSAQRKPQQQVLIQQALPPSSLMGPAFIFPFNQQQEALSAMPNTGKSQATASSGSASAVPQSMSLNYPSMGGANETQYLAILQNNGYPFPISAGLPPNFRGPPPPQAMPMFNGPFYASQMIHPSQSPVSQPQQLNANLSNSSSLSKHLQQNPQSSRGFGSRNSNLQQNLGSQKSHKDQHANLSRPRQPVDGEINGEDSSSNDGRGSRAPAVNIYGQNFPMPIHPQNFAVMTPSAAFGSQSEKKTNQTQQQQQGVVVMNNVETFSTTPHGFAMSFGPMNGTSPAPNIDMSSMVQHHHAMFQASQKKNSRVSEDGKSGGVSESSNANDDERKGIPGKSHGHSIAFTRSDLPNHNNNSGGHARSSSRPSTTINVQNPYIQAQIQQQQQQQSITRSEPDHNNNSGGHARSSSRPSTTINVQNPYIQAQIQQQQIMQLQKQQQQQLAANHRSNVPVTSNGSSVYTEHLNAPSTIAAKYPIVQMTSSSSPVQSQSPQWKGGSTSARTSTSQAVQSPFPSSSSSNLKGVPQQTSRAQPPMHTQISFGANLNKPSSASSQGQVQGSGGNNLTPSSPMMASVSPTTSSISKGASGSSPRLSVSASTNSKISHQGSSTLSTQQPKDSQSMPGQKAPSILGNHPHVDSSLNSGAKQTSQQQQFMKNMQQAPQLFFSNPFAQVQSSPSNASSGSYYMNHQKKRPTDKNQHQQLRQGGTSSSGMLSLSPSSIALANSTNDPAKALAAATGAGKNGGLPSQGVFNASQFAAAQTGGGVLFPGFPYHQQPVAPASVQTKPTEQKQPAGNDNLRTCQPEKK